MTKIQTVGASERKPTYVVFTIVQKSVNLEVFHKLINSVRTNRKLDKHATVVASVALSESSVQ